MPLTSEQVNIISEQVNLLVKVPTDPDPLRVFASDFLNSLKNPNKPAQACAKFIKLLHEPRKYFETFEYDQNPMLHEVRYEILNALLKKIIAASNALQLDLNQLDIDETTVFSYLPVSKKTDSFFPFDLYIEDIALPETPGFCYTQETYIDTSNGHNRIGVKIGYRGFPLVTHYLQTIHSFYNQDELQLFSTQIKKQAIEAVKIYVYKKNIAEFSSIYRLVKNIKDRKHIKYFFRLIELEDYLELALKRKLNPENLRGLSPQQFQNLTHPTISFLIKKGHLSILQAKALTLPQIELLEQYEIETLIINNISTAEELISLPKAHKDLLLTKDYQKLLKNDEIYWPDFIGLSSKQCQFLLLPSMLYLVGDGYWQINDVLLITESKLAYIAAHPTFLYGLENLLLSANEVQNQDDLEDLHAKIFLIRLEKIFNGTTKSATALENLIKDMQSESKLIQTVFKKFLLNLKGLIQTYKTNGNVAIATKLLDCIPSAEKTNDWISPLENLITQGRALRREIFSPKLYTEKATFCTIQNINSICKNLAGLAPLYDIDFDLDYKPPTPS